MKKLVPILLAVLVLMTCLATAEETSNDVRMYVLCKPGDYVNVRERPSTRSTIAGYLECGDYIETDGVTKKDGQGRQWTHITKPTFEAQDAWVCSMYLQDTEIVISKCSAYVVANGRTALRRSPGGKKVKWAKNGAELSVLAMSEEWALTTLGYIRREFIDVYYE